MGRHLILEMTPKPPKPTPAELDEAMTPAEAREFGMFVSSDCYPWYALTGRKFPIPNDWSRHVYEEKINVYTDAEVILRQVIKETIRSLEGIGFTSAYIEGIRNNLLKSLEKTKLPPI